MAGFDDAWSDLSTARRRIGRRGVYISVGTSQLKIAVACIVTAALLLAGLMYAYAEISRRTAEKLLGDLRQFSSTEDFEQTFSSFRKQHGESLRQQPGCASAYCAWEIRVSSVPRPLQRGLPYTDLSAVFLGRGGKADGVLIEYTTRRVEGVSPIVHIQIDPCTKTCERSFYLHPHGESAELWNGIIEINPQATSKERQAAFALDLSCFTKIRGCDDIAQMLPSVWKHIDTRTLLSRVPSMADASWDKPQQ